MDGNLPLSATMSSAISKRDTAQVEGRIPVTHLRNLHTESFKTNSV
jgi:hypothetical protein